MSEFTRQNVYDIERAITDLHEKKAELVNTKKELQNKLTTLTNKVRTNGRKLNDVEYRKLCSQQEKTMQEVVKIDNEIILIKNDISRKSTLKQEIQSTFKSNENEDVVVSLTAIKDHYISFAADRSRISSMRAMASEFVEKLEVVIRKL